MQKKERTGVRSHVKYKFVTRMCSRHLQAMPLL